MNERKVFPERFKGQVVLITGAADGLGKAIAKRIAAEGGALALFDLNEALLGQFADELRRVTAEFCSLLPSPAKREIRAWYPIQRAKRG